MGQLKFKPSIINYSSVSDIKMVLSELKDELTVFDAETNEKLMKLLCDKQQEVEDRYNR